MISAVLGPGACMAQLSETDDVLNPCIPRNPFGFLCCCTNLSLILCYSAAEVADMSTNSAIELLVQKT